MMKRIQDGEKIQATRHGQLITGTVESSRVKYGGSIQYTVILDQPVFLSWREEAVSIILINSKEIA
jgi:hypothetical protein